MRVAPKVACKPPPHSMAGIGHKTQVVRAADCRRAVRLLGEIECEGSDSLQAAMGLPRLRARVVEGVHVKVINAELDVPAKVGLEDLVDAFVPGRDPRDP